MIKYWKWAHKRYYQLGSENTHIVFWWRGFSHGRASYFWIKMFGLNLITFLIAHPKSQIGWWFKGLCSRIQIKILKWNIIPIQQIDD